MINAWNVAAARDALTPDVRCLSLDCFDTLLWRLGNAPRDVFADLEMAGGAIERRMHAEGIARGSQTQNRNPREVSFADIYRIMMPYASDAEREAAIARELVAEARHCFAFTPVVDLLREARARGLKTIIVSDTYLNVDQLRTLIAEAAGEEVAGLIDRVFASSDYGKSKSGGLFEDVLADLGIPADAIVHMGDNYHADVVGVGRFGVRTLHLGQFAGVAEQRLRFEAAASAMIDPSVRVTVPAAQPHRARVALNAVNDTAYALGHDVLGPIFEGFARWLQDEIAALEVEHGRPVRPLFLLRDGELPWKVFDALGGAGGNRVALSRFTARAAGFSAPGAIDRYFAEESHDRIDAHLKQLLLSRGDLPAQPTSYDALKAMVALPAVTAKIETRAAAFADRLAKHLRSEGGVEDGDTLLLIDLGYNGSVQDNAEPVLRCLFGGHVAGRYLLLRKMAETPFDKRGFLDARHYDHRILAALAAPIAVVEQLATASCGSVVDYAPNGTPTRARCDYSKTQIAIRDRAQAGAVAFARAAATDPCAAGVDITPDIRRRAAAGALARLLFLPLPQEIALLAAFEHDVNLGVNDTNRLVDLDRSGDDLRAAGLAYLNRTRRLFPAGELSGHGFGLALANFATLRLGNDLRAADFETGGIKVPVIVADATEQSAIDVTAWPTHDGFMRLAVPIGRRALTVGVMLGGVASHAEIERVEFQPMSRLTDPSWDGVEGVVPATLDAEGMTAAAGTLYACDSASMLVVRPPAVFMDDYVAVVVFRPLGERNAMAARKAA